MTTKTTTKAQIQSQLEEARTVIDRQRNEIAGLKEEIEKLKKENEDLKTAHQLPTLGGAWEFVKKSWRRCDTNAYYRLASSSPGAMGIAQQAQKELERSDKHLFVSTSNGEVYVAVRK